MKYNIFISACLAGEPTRYNGKANPIQNDFLKKLKVKSNLFNFCPEIASGLKAKRKPCEIVKEFDEIDNIYKKYMIIDINNNEFTNYFIKGALLALKYAKKMNIEFAILKDGSPSCGTTYIHDGSFSCRQRRGKGVTAYLFKKHNILCFNEKNFKRHPHFGRLLCK